MLETRKTNPWFRSDPTRRRRTLRLFCLPYAGGAATIFRSWSDGLPPAIEVLPIQLPGRGSRYFEPPFTRLTPLVETLTEVVRPYLNLPYAIFGHSLGALIAFELARQVHRQYGVSPAHLFVAAYPAPKWPKPLPAIANLSDYAFVAELRRLEGTPREVLEHQELIDLYLPLLRADFAISETYVFTPGPPLSCPITAIGGLADHIVDRSGLAAWNEQTYKAFTVSMVPGDHFFLHKEREAILKVIAESLSPFA